MICCDVTQKLRGAGRSPKMSLAKNTSRQSARETQLEATQTRTGTSTFPSLRRYVGASRAVRGAAVRAVSGGNYGRREGREGHSRVPELQQTGGTGS